MTAVVIIVAVCLGLEAFFSGSELALLSADRIRLRARAQAGGRRGRIVARHLDRPEILIATTLIGTTLCVGVATVTMTLWILRHAPERAELISVAVMAPLVLVVGEIVPKSVFQAHADAIAPRAIYLLWGFYAVLAPAVGVASRVSDVFLRLLGIHERRPFIEREELRLLLRQESAGRPEADRITDAERRMITAILEFSEKTTESAMLPLSEVCALSARATLDEAAAELMDKGYTRAPVYRDRIDQIEGVVHAFDLLRAPAEARTVADVARPPVFVPESQPAAACLARLQRERQGMAIVVNEYGGAEGVVTIEDILEEVVGEIEDEYDDAPPLIRREGPGVWLVLGRARIDVLNQELRLALPESEEYETVAGLVIERLKRIPRTGDQVSVGAATISVTAASDRSVEEVRIEARARR